MTDVPIELWHAVVYPSVVDPQQHVGIELVVVLQTVGVATYGRTLLVAVDTKGRHAKLDPRLELVYVLAHLLDKEIDIVAAPVATVGYTIII